MAYQLLAAGVSGLAKSYNMHLKLELKKYHRDNITSNLSTYDTCHV